jgi:hypothetical protein
MSKTANDIITASHVAAAAFTDSEVRQAHRLGFLEAELKKLVDKYEGVRDPLCKYLETELGDSPILIEYEYEAGEDAVWDLNSPMCGPGTPETVYIGMALVNGHWTSTEGWPTAWLDKWTQQIVDQEQDQRQEDYETRKSEREY